MAQKRHSRQATGAEGVAGASGWWDNLRLFWRLFRDPRVSPRLKRIVPIVALIYLVSPIDVIPDLIVGLGQTDDLGVIGLAVALVLAALRRAPGTIVREHLGAMGSRSRWWQRQDHSTVIETSFRMVEPTDTNQTVRPN